MKLYWVLHCDVVRLVRAKTKKELIKILEADEDYFIMREVPTEIKEIKFQGESKILECY